MSRWEEMTEKERRDYVNQDRNGRRITREYLESEMGRGVFNAVAEKHGLADVVSSDTSVIDEIFKNALSPLEYAIAWKFYVDGRSYKEIARSITICHRSDGEEISSKAMTWRMVQWELTKIRNKIKALLPDSASLSTCRK